MKQFSELGLAESVLRAVSSEGYTRPTPIQADVIPAMLAGNDIVGIAQTGTGKTAAFVLPLLHRIAEQNRRPQPKTARALIITPTRELAAQIADNINAYGQHIRHSSAVVIGGAKPGPQIRALARGVDIIVATPGRLEDHMQTGAIGLTETDTVILDEADQMLDLGFMPAIRRILAKLPEDRQTLLLSATMPKQIRSLASDFLNDPVEVTIARVATPVELIEQKVIFVDKASKRSTLVEIISNEAIERAIIFTRTKRGADVVTKHLNRLEIPSAAIHGNKSQNQRKRALANFKSGHVGILVATDIAARGIDVDNVSHVINFELPNIPESYVHRIGRTARAGKSGRAISLCDPSEREYLADIEKLIGAGIRQDRDASSYDPAELGPPVKTKKKQRTRSRGGRPGRNHRGGADRSGDGAGAARHHGRPGQKRRRSKPKAKSPAK